MLRGCPLIRALVPLGATLVVGLTACDSNKAVNKGADGGMHHPTDGGMHHPTDAGTHHPPAADAGGSVPVRQDGGVSRDSGRTAPEADAAVPGLQPCTGAPPVMKSLDTNTNMEFDPDWSCYGGSDGGVAAPDAAADAGAPRPFATLRLAPLPQALFGDPTVDVFFGPSTLGTPAYTRTFGGDGGTVSFPLPAGSASVSLHLHELLTPDPSYSILELFEYGLPVLDVHIEGFVTLKASMALSVNLALGGGQEDPGKALLVSYARDCAGHPVSGAQFELVDGATNLPVPTGTGAGDARSSYARFALPTTTCTFTTNEQFEASWMLVNAPVNVMNGAKTRSYRLRFKGRMHESDVAPVILGEREVELFPGGTSFARVDR